MAAEADLTTRLRVMGLDEPTRTRLARLGPELRCGLEPALEGLYAHIRTTPELRRFFADDAAMDRARRLQLGHWQRLLEARFDTAYLASAHETGEAHWRIGFEPGAYMAGYGCLLAGLIRHLLENRARKPIWSARERERQALDLAADIAALLRAALLDMDLAITDYVRWFEDDRQRDARALQRALQELAAGKLDVTVDPELDRKTSFNATVARLRETITLAGDAARTIARGTAEIAAAADDLARRTEQQAASLEQTTTALDQLTRTVKDTARRTEAANARAAEGRQLCDTAETVIRETREAMDRIAASADEVAQVLGLIDGIAFQTNLLALNAGVEAARAGEAGRGFAVVATEVRQLAQRSAEAARHVKQLVERSTDHVARGRRQVDTTADALHRIVATLTDVATALHDIAAAARQQAAAVDDIHAAMNHLDQVTQQNAAMVQQTTAATASLADQANRLTHHIALFHLPPRTLPTAA